MNETKNSSRISITGNFDVRFTEQGLELSIRADSPASTSGNTNDGPELRCGGRDSIHLRSVHPVDYPHGEFVGDPKPVPDGYVLVGSDFVRDKYHFYKREKYCNGDGRVCFKLRKLVEQREELRKFDEQPLEHVVIAELRELLKQKQFVIDELRKLRPITVKLVERKQQWEWSKQLKLSK